MTSAAVTPKRIDPPGMDTPLHVEADAIVLPNEIAEDGRGLYSDSLLGLVKQLRQTGISAEYQYNSDKRSWIGEKGFAAIALDLVIGITSNAGWAAICTFLLGRGRSRVHVKIARCTQNTATGTTSWEWYEVTGEGAEAAAALEGLGFVARSLPNSSDDNDKNEPPG